MRYLIFSILMASQCFGATYFVSPTGNDSSVDPTNPSTPWKTLSKVTSFSAGTGFATEDNILFERGKEFESEQQGIDLNASDGFGGSSSVQSIVGAYGTGARPIFWGAELTGTWGQESTDNNVYSKDIGAIPSLAIDENSALMTFKIWDTDIATTALAVSEFTINGTVIYVRATGSVDPDTLSPLPRVAAAHDVADTSRGVIIDDASYVTVRDIEFRGWDLTGVRAFNRTGSSNSDIRIENCVNKYSGEQGISASNLSASSSDLYTNIVIDSCTSIGSGASGISGGGGTGSSTPNAFLTVQNCSVSENAWVSSGNGMNFGGGATIQVLDCVAFNNLNIGSDGEGIAFDNNTVNSLIERCTAYGNEGTGLQSSNAGTQNNTIQNCISYSNTNYGVRIGALSANCFVLNNTCYDNDRGIFCESGSATVKNNICSENISTEISIDTGDVSDNNCVYHPLGGTFMNFDSVNYNYADYLDNSGQDVNSINTDPIVFSLTNNNFNLKPESPCIDTGDNVDVTSDFNGNPIIGIHDIGAYENQQQLFGRPRGETAPRIFRGRRY